MENCRKSIPGSGEVISIRVRTKLKYKSDIKEAACNADTVFAITAY